MFFSTSLNDSGLAMFIFIAGRWASITSLEPPTSIAFTSLKAAFAALIASGFIMSSSPSVTSTSL